MISPCLYSQQSLDQYGFIGNSSNSSFRNNSIESNVVNYSTIEDWELSLSFKNRLRGSSNINLSSASISKRFGYNYFYFRYTPGYLQEYVFNSRTEFLLEDTLQNYKTNLSYSEKYGLGYSASINENFTIGFSLRYFQQDFREEYPTFYIDTVNNTSLIQIREETVNKNFWRGDIGLLYQIQKDFKLGISSINLFIIKDFDEENNESEFDIKKDIYNLKEDKELNIHLEYENELWAIRAEYETSNSSALGINRAFSIGNSSLSLGIQVFHDAYQNPFIAGFIPVVNYSTNLFSLSLSYYKYLSDRSEI
ncbi:MAG: hypothetical protein R3250_18175, partial [Melioribacteraceae bacterium]|nr:hypothetical protein [Melioribacteraceae bacterium]